jgi:hypothetical protein
VHLTRGRVELATGQGELVFEQLHLSLQLGYLAVVFSDTTFELTV